MKSRPHLVGGSRGEELTREYTRNNEKEYQKRNPGGRGNEYSYIYSSLARFSFAVYTTKILVFFFAGGQVSRRVGGGGSIMCVQ